MTALLLYCEYTTTNNENVSSTETDVKWKPGSNKEILYATVENLDFGRRGNSKTCKSIHNIPLLADEEIVNLLKDVNNSGVTTSLALTMQPLCDIIRKRPKSISIV